MEPSRQNEWARGPLHVEIQCTLEFLSSLHVGTGERLAVDTDAPLLRTSDGKPWLPGSSVRGVLRDWCEREAPLLGLDNNTIARMFGVAAEDRKRLGQDHDRQGRLIVRDVVFDDVAPPANVRDHVRLQPDWGAAARGGKFDHELVRVKSGTLTMVYEGWPGDPELTLLPSLVAAMKEGVAFGGKTGWGLGICRATAAKWSSQNRTQSDTLSGYLRRRIMHDGSEAAFEQVPTPVSPIAANAAKNARSWMRVEFDLQFDGPMLVAAPYGGQNSDSREARADSTYQVDFDGRPLLPGSSLRGAMRAQARRIAARMGDMEAEQELFGPNTSDAGTEIVTGDGVDTQPDSDRSRKKKRRGLISVEEARLVGLAQTVLLNHVAIDRLTGFAADGRLFSAMALASPTFRCAASVRWLSHNPTHQRAVRLLLLTLRDLGSGSMWMGSRTTRGYGRVKSVTKVSVTCSVVAREGETEDGVAQRLNTQTFTSCSIRGLDRHLIAQFVEDGHA